MKGRRRAQEARNMRKHEMKPHKTRRRRKFPHQAKVDTSTTHTFTIERRQTRAPKEQEESNQLDRQTRAAHKDGNTKQRQTQRDKREREREREREGRESLQLEPANAIVVTKKGKVVRKHTHTHAHTRIHTQSRSKVVIERKVKKHNMFRPGLGTRDFVEAVLAIR